MSSKYKSSGWLWLPVAWMFTDCVASIKFVTPLELPFGASSSTPGSSSGAGGGGSSVDDDSASAVLVDKASARFFRFQRGELVVLK